mgnify:CR=1 FL=1
MYTSLEIRRNFANHCKERNPSKGNLQPLFILVINKIFLRLNTKLIGRVFFYFFIDCYFSEIAIPKRDKLRKCTHEAATEVSFILKGKRQCMP